MIDVQKKFFIPLYQATYIIHSHLIIHYLGNEFFLYPIWIFNIVVVDFNSINVKPLWIYDQYFFVIWLEVV